MPRDVRPVDLAREDGPRTQGTGDLGAVVNDRRTDVLGRGATDFAPVVTVNVTIMDGVVVRWFRSVGHAEVGEAVVAASRHGLTVDIGSTILPLAAVDGLVETVTRAAEVARSINLGANPSYLATHRKEGMFGPLVPVEASS